MPIFSIAKIFYIFAFLPGNVFLSMLSEPNFKLYGAFNRACGRSCRLAPEGILKAFSRLFMTRSSKFFEGDAGVCF